MNVKLSFVICEEAVGLVASVVLGAETPVHMWKHWLLFEVYCAEDTAAYFCFPSSDVEK
jgi:hypothetical protein